MEWLWDGRIAIGTLALLAGREGLGKSILAYTLAALITRGMLPGEYFGAPKSVVVAATEDSWSQTIGPRLIAAGADRDRVYRVEVIADDVHTELTLPRDLVKMRNVAREVDAVLLILDPLLSRLDDRLDTHKDADVRRALEPLVAAADMINLAVLGLIHHNKSGSSDPLQVIMGSKAFAAVARSVHTVIYDPDDDSKAHRLFGTPKNNLGRSGLPTLSFTIEPFAVPVDDGNDLAWTGQLVWREGSAHSIHDAMERAAESGEQKVCGNGCPALARGFPDLERRHMRIRQDQANGTGGRAHRAIAAHSTDAPQGRNLGTRLSAPNVVELAFEDTQISCDQPVVTLQS